MSNANKKLRLYPPGSVVNFVDESATVSTGDRVLVTGTVNGRAMQFEDGTIYWPIWAERDKGREPTTIMVHEDNVAGFAEEG